MVSFYNEELTKRENLRNLIALVCLAYMFATSKRNRVKAEVYSLEDNIVGQGFYDAFEWQIFDDPTHGVVNYVDMDTAKADNLSYATDDLFIMRADSTRVVPSWARGRDSVRITSYKNYTDGLYVLDLNHMPSGCSTWPAWWTVGASWPDLGEIDIIEGVNGQGADLVSLHTSAGCSQPQSRTMTGYPTSNDCNVAANYNQGCGVALSESTSFGPSFNEVGGGWYVMQRSAQAGVSVWFWARNDTSVPSQVAYGSGSVDTSNFGTPDAAFVCDDCDWSSHFGQHSIVFDLTFCGDWAGTVYSSSGCPSTCSDYVLNHPAGFRNAYWSINALRTYT